MPLAGNLRQFALADVVRVIESGQRTGRLMLHRADRRALVYFSGGQWVFTERVGSNLVLAHLLARVGLITPGQFETAMGVPFVQAGSIPDAKVARALITSRVLKQEQLRAFAENDALELLTFVLTWPDGEFSFEDDVSIPPGRVAIALPVGPLLAKAVRAGRGASTPMREVVPLAPETILDFADIDPKSGVAVTLTRDQWRLLTAIDGRIPLWAIIQRLQAPDRIILRLAAELVTNGTLVVVGRGSQFS
jgi:Domain of unknown function (DUF4388)